MKPVSQISLFGDEPIAAEDTPANGPSVQPVNVRLRIKKLKEPAVKPEPETKVFVSVPAKPVQAPDMAAFEKKQLDSEPVEDRLVAAPVKTALKKGKSTRGRKSIKAVEAEADLISVPEDEILFQKQYYTMGEVASMFRVNQSLLRFWEAEFSILQPHKNKKGDRYFRPVDVKNLHLIYHLLRQRKYTIEGAKDFLKKNKKANQRFEVIKKLEQIRAFILELKAQL